MVPNKTEKNGQTLLLDLQMGVAGDMLLSSLIDLAINAGLLTADEIENLLMKSLSLYDGVSAEIKKKQVSGIFARGVWVRNEDHHYGDHKHMKGLEMRDNIIEAARTADLSQGALDYAVRAIDEILNAEAYLHSNTVEELHLHETGAPDTVVEIIGSAFILERLGFFNENQRIIATPISVGMGSISISHGTVPIPAPATLHIMKNMKFKFGPVPGELATPTGTALVKSLEPEYVENFSDISFEPIAAGYGLGKRKYQDRYLNVVRAVLCK